MSGQNRWGHPGVFIAFAILAVLFVVGISLFAFGYVAPKPSSGFYFFPYFPFGIFWAFLLVFFAFGILRWTFWGWRWRRGGYYGGYHRRYDQAHQILRERYARGEITKEQLDQMTRDLDDHS